MTYEKGCQLKCWRIDIKRIASYCATYEAMKQMYLIKNSFGGNNNGLRRINDNVR